MIGTEDTTFWTFMLVGAIMAAFALMVVFFWFNWWYSKRERGASPYTGMPLRYARDLSFFAIDRVLLFLYNFQQYDNRIFQIKKAAYCRDTGRIFTNCVDMFDIIRVDWTFLQKRYPGHYVSWGSLNDQQKKAIMDAHESLEGFQTEFSSPNPAPRAVEPEYVYTKPGPLYVDLDTKVLLGWKEVPDTELEVLIVQKPKKDIR